MASIESTTTAATYEDVQRAIIEVGEVYDARVTHSDRQRAKHAPCDPKFVRDLVSCGTTRLWRHGWRKIGDGHIASGVGRLVAAPFTGAVAALSMVPGGLGYWVGAHVAHLHQRRGLVRSAVGIREDKIAGEVVRLRDALAAFAPVRGTLDTLVAPERDYATLAGDVRQVLWDLEATMRHDTLAPHRLARSPVLRAAMHRAIRSADRLDDQRRKKRAQDLRDQGVLTP